VTRRAGQPKSADMMAARSLVFLFWMYGLLVVMGLIWLPSLLLPRGVLIFGIRVWTRLVRWGLRVICGVHTEVRGLDHLPDGPVRRRSCA